jgi:hypothetical protein
MTAHDSEQSNVHKRRHTMHTKLLPAVGAVELAVMAADLDAHPPPRYSLPSAPRSSPSAFGADVDTTWLVAYLPRSPPSSSTCFWIQSYVICTRGER